MDKTYFILAGNVDKNIPTKWICDTLEDKKKAIKEGYNAFSSMSFSSPYDKNKPEPVRKGDLWVEIKSPDIHKSIIGGKQFIDSMTTHISNFEPNCVQYFINGNESVQLCFPAGLYGDNNGHIYLPYIHKLMLKRLNNFYHIGFDSNLSCSVNFDVYAMGNGYLLRQENMLLPDGRYRIQVSASEFMNGDVDTLADLSIFPTPNDFQELPIIKETGLKQIFEAMSLPFWYSVSDNSYLDSLYECKFFLYCLDKIDTIDEDKLKYLFKLLRSVYAVKFDTLQSLCQYRNDYDKLAILFNECDSLSMSCENIRKIYDCPKDCDVNCPFDIINKQKADTVCANNSYKLVADGLYYSPSQWVNEGDATKVCSHLCVEGMIRDEKGTSWGRLVTVKDPDGVMHTEKIRMAECVGTGDAVISRLCDSGLEIEPNKKSLVLDYLRKSDAHIRYTETGKLGWQKDGTYVLPDASYGYNKQTRYHFPYGNKLYNTAGTLTDWIEHIGNKCIGHVFPEFVCQVALSGVLIRPLGMEGGGFHLYGNSSRGKTSLAYLAGSVCGGDGRHGFVYQWRGTTNAYERIAVQHNDGLLILDEIGQAPAQTVAPMMYMLFNGKTKERCRPDATLCTSEEWVLNCLSTGEKTIREKISEDRFLKAMVGQEIRMPDIPVISDGVNQIYSSDMDEKSQAELSEYFKNMSNKFYGTPLRRFLEIFNGEDKTKYYLSKSKEIIEKFTDEKCPASASGQVRRVARKFGLIAAVGYIAVNEGIFPWSHDDAYECVNYIYDLWFKERGSLIDMEIENAISALYNFIDNKGKSSFIPKDDYDSIPEAGYVFNDNDNKYTAYFFLPEIFNKITYGVNKSMLLAELDKRNMLLKNSEGNMRETISVKNKGVRGYGIIRNIICNDNEE